MAGIRELKDRIASIRSARKITTAMQMVASSKLKKASKAVESFVPYQRMLGMILDDFLAYEQETDSPFVQKRKIKHVTIVAFSSGSGFCGAFNSTIINRLQREIDEWKKTDIVHFKIVGVGKKVSDALRKFDFKGTSEEWNRLVEHPDYEGSKELADHLMDNYKKKLTDKVVLIYFSYQHPMVHELRIVDYLQIDL